MTRASRLRPIALSAFAGGTLALWVAAATTIIKVAQASSHSSDDFDVSTPVTLAVGSVSLFFVLFLLKMPSGFRHLILKRRFPDAFIANGSANTEVRTQFAAKHFTAMIDHKHRSLAFSFTLMADNEGLSFWIGFVEPLRFAHIPWDEITTIDITSRQVMTERIPMLHIVNVANENLGFIVTHNTLFGLFRRGERGTQAVVELLTTYLPRGHEHG